MVNVKRTVLVPHCSEIFACNHADTIFHTIDLRPILLCNKVKAAIIGVELVSGSGSMDFAAAGVEGVREIRAVNQTDVALVTLNDGYLKYQQTNSGDSWKVYCFGYFREDAN